MAAILGPELSAVIGYSAATLWRDGRRETGPVRPPSPSVADVG